jgi:hypothetical protein
LAKVGKEIRRFGLYSEPAVINVTDSFLNLPNPHFVPLIRPRYATVNYAKTTSGSVHWGRSFLQLKDDARSKATYICQDSFEALLMQGKDKMSRGGFPEHDVERKP